MEIILKRGSMKMFARLCRNPLLKFLRDLPLFSVWMRKEAKFPRWGVLVYLFRHPGKITSRLWPILINGLLLSHDWFYLDLLETGRILANQMFFQRIFGPSCSVLLHFAWFGCFDFLVRRHP